MNSTPRLTKKQRRQLRRETKEEKPGLKIREIKPKTKNQNRVFESFYEDQNLFLNGFPGTGKSFLALYLSLEKILSNLTIYEKLVIVRSAVPTRDIGFLPGSTKEKLREYEVPYQEICADLFERKDAYNYLKGQEKIEFISTSFNRGITISNAFVFVDEVQNLTSHEIHSIITRIGKNCKIIMAGDFYQSDLKMRRQNSGILDFIQIAKKMREFSFIEFGINDIVRSEFVKRYILARHELEKTDAITPL